MSESTDPMTGWKIPEKTEVTRALDLIGDPQNARMFFSGLENPHWLNVLRDQGLLSASPEVKDLTGNGKPLPDWPVAIYLKRMAPLLPDQVTEILLHVDTHDNAFAQMRVLEVAIDLPPKQAARLVERAIGFLGESVRDVVAARVTELLETVAKSGELATTKLLADAVFRPPGKLDDVWFGIELPKATLALRAFGTESVSILTDWLHALEERDGSWNSHVYRPSISPHQQNWGHNLVNPLVDAARDTSTNLVNEDPGS